MTPFKRAHSDIPHIHIPRHMRQNTTYSNNNNYLEKERKKGTNKYLHGGSSLPRYPRYCPTSQPPTHTHTVKSSDERTMKPVLLHLTDGQNVPKKIVERKLHGSASSSQDGYNHSTTTVSQRQHLLGPPQTPNP